MWHLFIAGIERAKKYLEIFVAQRSEFNNVGIIALVSIKVGSAKESKEPSEERILDDDDEHVNQAGLKIV